MKQIRRLTLLMSTAIFAIALLGVERSQARTENSGSLTDPGSPGDHERGSNREQELTVLEPFVTKAHRVPFHVATEETKASGERHVVPAIS